MAKTALLFLFAGLLLRAKAVPGIGIYTEYQTAPPAAVEQAMRAELDAILAPIGFDLAWRSLRKGSAGESAVRIAIVHFRGRCDGESLSPYSQNRLGSLQEPEVLGDASVSDGEVLPYATVYCDSIREFLAGELLRMDAGPREAAYGRAIGRVLAHELYHIFAQTTRHGTRGVGAPEYSPEMLLEEHFRFGERETRKLRQFLAPILLQVNRITRGESQNGFAVFVRSGCAGCHGIGGAGTKWGPALGPDRDAAQMTRRLNDSGTKMYKMAQNLAVLWPRLNPVEIRDLVRFLNHRRGKPGQENHPGSGRIGGPKILPSHCKYK